MAFGCPVQVPDTASVITPLLTFVECLQNYEVKPRSEGNSPGSKQSSGSGRTQEPKSPSDVSTIEISIFSEGVG